MCLLRQHRFRAVDLVRRRRDLVGIEPVIDADHSREVFIRRDCLRQQPATMGEPASIKGGQQRIWRGAQPGSLPTTGAILLKQLRVLSRNPVKQDANRVTDQHCG